MSHNDPHQPPSHDGQGSHAASSGPQHSQQSGPYSQGQGGQPSPYGQQSQGHQPASYGQQGHQPGQYEQQGHGNQPAQYGAPGGYGSPQGYGPPSYQGQQQGGTVDAHTGLINIAGLGTVKLATIGQRFLARLIDSVVYGLVVGLLMFLVVGVASGEDMENGGGGATIGTMFLSMVLYGLFVLLYEFVMIAVKGATLGKMAMGVKVVQQANGQNPGFGPSFIRILIPVIGAFLCYIGQILVYLSPLFDGSGRMQGWHDKAANDVVINVK